MGVRTGWRPIAASQEEAGHRVRGRDPIVLAMGVIVVAAFYRSITFWTVNAWDLSSPLKILTIAAGLTALGVALLLLLTRIGIDWLAGGLAIGGLLLLLSHWRHIPGIIGMALLWLILIIAWVCQRADSSILPRWLAVTIVIAFGAVPMVQLVVAHVRDSAPYQLADLPAPGPASASAVVEDVVLVIVDSYPNLRLAQSWFGHQPDALTEALRGSGFEVPASAWSQNTFTSLSVGSMLELASVIDAGTTPPYGNRSSLWRILRGDNLVSATLQSAGYLYTHIESGWDGTSCGPKVERCIDSRWLDEQMWQLLSPTIAGNLIGIRHHFVEVTLDAARKLESELVSLQANGSHDYVFAHLLLPHEPVIVDDTCQPLDPVSTTTDLKVRRRLLEGQITCVDHLLTNVAQMVGDDTAILMTGDHGTGTSGQVGRPPEEWSDADIAERLGVFMAYRLPASCPSPLWEAPREAMRTILSCAVNVEFSTSAPEYLIGAQDPMAVDPVRMDRIKDEVLAGTLRPDQG